MAKATGPLDWNDLKLIKAIAESGSPGAAADPLALDPTTVARRLLQVERSLDLAIFERRRSGYKLTPAGESLFALAQRVDDDVRSVARQLGDRQRPRGELRVATSDIMTAHFLAPQLPQFRRLHPEIRLCFIQDNMEANLSREEADVALRVTNAPTETLVGRRIGRVAWALYGRRRDFAAPPPNLARLFAACEWVNLTDDLWIARVAKFVHGQVAGQRIVYKVNSVLAMAQAVEQGVGIGYLPCFIGDTSASLLRLEAPRPELSDDLWLLTHPDLRRSARVRVFMDFVAAELERQRPLIEGRAA